MVRTVNAVLLVLEDQGDRLVLGPYHADHHSAIRGKGVTLESNRPRLRGGHLKNAVIPAGLALEVFAGMNCGVAFGIRHIAVKVGLGSAFIHETAGDGDDALAVVDRHGTRLDDGLTGKIALGRYQRPRAVEGTVVPRDSRQREEKRRQDGSRN